MKKIILVLIVLCNMAFVPDNATDVEMYIVDSAKSQVIWTGYYLFSFGEHYGTVNVSKGEIILQNKEITKGTFEIDMHSLYNVDMAPEEGGSDLITHLKSDDFFSVEKYPKAKFVITRTTKIKNAKPEDMNYEITGDLTLKGVTKPLTFNAHVYFEGNVLLTQARFKIDRTKWGIHYNSGKFFSEIGDGAISDAIGIHLKIVTIKDPC